jgi:putative hemolysin
MLIASESTSVLLPPVVPATLPLYPEPLPQVPANRSFQLEAGPYVARLALTEQERAETYRLRFMVFNLELNEGLQSAYVDGFDKDRFDDVCDHLIVQERSTGAVVGTYRIQMGDIAGCNFGYYSEQEFCFGPYEVMRSQIVELGRACIHRDHRSSEVARPRPLLAAEWWTLHDGLLLAALTRRRSGLRHL